MADLLSISSLMISGELITTAVAGPSLREKMLPYCCAHSVNLGNDQACSVDFGVGRHFHLKCAPVFGI